MEGQDKILGSLFWVFGASAIISYLSVFFFFGAFTQYMSVLNDPRYLPTTGTIEKISALEEIFSKRDQYSKLDEDDFLLVLTVRYQVDGKEYWNMSVVRPPGAPDILWTIEDVIAAARIVSPGQPITLSRKHLGELDYPKLRDQHYDLGVKGKHPVWYDPKDPGISVLTRGAWSWKTLGVQSALFLCFYLMVAVGVVFLFRNHSLAGKLGGFAALTLGIGLGVWYGMHSLKKKPDTSIPSTQDKPAKYEIVVHEGTPELKFPLE